MGRAGGAGGGHSGGGHSFGGGHSGAGRSSFSSGRSSFGGGSFGSTTGGSDSFSGRSSGSFGSATSGSSPGSIFSNSPSGGNSFGRVHYNHSYDYNESPNNTENCSESGTYSVPYKPEEVFAALKTVVPKINGFTVINISDSEMSLDIDVGMSLKSIGETIKISVSPSSAHDSMLSMISESTSAAIDWGKNAENLNSIVDALQKELINFKAVHNKNASTGNRQMVSVLCGSMLFLLICIVVSFSIMEYETPWYIWTGILLMASAIVWNNLRDRKEETAGLPAGTLETPVKDLGDEEAETLVDKYLTDLNRNLEEIKIATENVSEEEARTKKLVNENKKEIEKLEELAKTALLEGNESEAKAFLEKKARFEAQEDDLKAAYTAACANSMKMRQMCDKLTANITELTSRREAIRVKESIAKTQEAINTLASNLDKAQGMEGAFVRMEENAEKMVDQVNAMLELNEKPADEAETLEKKYSDTGTKLVPQKAKTKIKSGR